MQYDVFISHASEDKALVARPLAEALETAGVQVWLDEVKIGWGDSLAEAIDRGLTQSRYGIVLLSRAFFAKRWTARELNGLVSRQMGEGRIVMLPIWVDVDAEFVREKSPPLADQKALPWSDGPEAIAARLRAMLDQAESFSSGGTVATVAGGVMVGRARALLQGRQPIAVEELIRAQMEAALAAMGAVEFDVGATFDDNQGYYDEFKRRMKRYAEVVEELTATLAVVTYHGGPEFGVVVRRCVERLSNEPNDLGKCISGGVPLWNDLRRYPTMLVFHRTACAAIAAEKWQNLRPLLVDTRVSIRPLEEVRVPILTKVRPCDFTHSSSDQWLASDGPTVRQEPYTPVEDYLAERVVESLSWLGLDRPEAERIFDKWLFLAHIAYLGIPENEGRWGTYFSAGRWWRIQRVGGWNGTPQAELIEYLRREGDNSSLLQSGAAPNAVVFLERAEATREMIFHKAFQ